MVDSEETLKQEVTLADVMKELIGINKELANINKKLAEHDAQFEAIREGIVDNSVAFDRLQGNFMHLRADVKEMTEDLRRDKLALK